MPIALNSLSAVAKDYSGLILDLWGVIHDGTDIYPGVSDTLKALKQEGKRVVFLSNAPRRARKVIAVLDALDIKPEWYEAVLSSGEVAYRNLREGKMELGTRYRFIGPERDADVLDGLGYTRVENAKDADFALNVGFGSDDRSLEDTAPVLGECLAARLPMLCLNPDREVVKITGERFPCAGVIADAYEAMGGYVHWFGKPYQEVYQACMEMLTPLGKEDVLAVGDGLHTDILGANNAGIKSVLVTGGILQGEWTHEEGEPEPDYILDAFHW